VSSEPARLRGESQRPGRSSGHDLRSRVWHWGSRLTITVGVMCAVARWGWATPLAEVLLFAFCAAFVTAGILAEDGLKAAPKVARISLWVGAAVPAVGGVVSTFGAAGVLLLLALLAISPAFGFLVRNNWFIPADDSEPTMPPTMSATQDRPTSHDTTVPEWRPETSSERSPLRHDVSAMDDAELCLAWRRSFRMLEAARTQSEHIALVVQRQRYLDEMQRRSPDGVAAWLASGARASSNPMPFLRGEGRGPSTWS
jgi:hypothetical protein